jgi:nicotinate dehydrogenase subunit B
MRLTRDARGAFRRAGFSRRDFLKTSGAVVVAFAGAGVVEPHAAVQGPFDTHPSHVDPKLLDSWIAVAADGSVTAYTGKAELGQGMFTVQTQLVAEELAVPLSRVKLIQCDTAITPDQGTTSGSQSTPTNFNDRNLALAAATAREALIRLASARLGVPAAALRAADGAVAVTGDSSKGVTYGELVAGRRFNLPLDPAARRRRPEDWTVLGRPIGRLDMPAMATGTFEYVHNVRVPGMLHGAVVRPPSIGATLARVDEQSVASLPGLVKVVVRASFVGVVAQKPWQAMQAAERLEVVWTPGPPLPDQAAYADHLRSAGPSRDTRLLDSGDVDRVLGGAAQVLKSTYYYPHQMHGSIGTSCAVADVRGGTATIWSPTQSAYPTRSGVAQLLGLKPDEVRVIFARGAGCYGLNGADTVSYDAALLSHAVGRPVRVQLSRRDEMAWENYGYAYVIDQRIGLGADGAIVAWDYEAWYPSLGGRPGYDTPGNVVTGWLTGFEPSRVTARAADRPEARFRNGSNAAPSYVAGCAGGVCSGAGTIRSERVVTHTVPSPFFTGPLRSPSRLQNTFAHESFMDEAAARSKADPVAFRLRHLADQRLRAVLDAAARAAGWDARPSPRPGASRTGVVTGRGVACVAYEGDNGYCAIVAEAAVDTATGAVLPKRFVIAHDCGPVSNPDGLKNQIEGGALQGMSRVLGEQVTWEGQEVTSVDWRAYHSLSLGFEMPRIEVVLLNRPDARATGAGETSITAVAAAIGNAVFDATGVRLRAAPFTRDRVKTALA